MTSTAEEQVCEVLKELIGDRLSVLDDPIYKFVVTVLESQTLPEFRVEDEEIVNTILPFLVETECYVTEQEAVEVLNLIVADLKKRGVIEEKKVETVVRLREAVDLGKVLRVQDEMGAIAVNTNEEINWEESASRAKMERKQRREEKARAAQMKEFDEYLKRRGLSEIHGLVKVHTTAADDQKLGGRDIHLENFDIHVGSKSLLEGASVMFAAGRRYGLVGRNGMGKTTFLRHLADREIDGIPPYMQILHIEQEVSGDDTSALECVLKTDVEREKLIQEEKDILERHPATDADSARLQKIYERMDQIDAHSAEARVSEILAGLGFTEEMQAMPTKSFSGGWRMRIALARALYIEPDILLLDEPTNHLDLHAVLWLENYLNSWTKTLVIVSHARNFLNAVVTDIIHLHNKQLVTYRGDYDTFDETRIELLKNQSRAREAQDMQRKHIQSFIDRFRYKAKTAKMAQSRIKMLEKMELIPALAEDPTFTFRLPNPEPCAPPFIQAVDVTFGFDKQKILFKDLNFSVDMDSRIALVGPNGAGKSTFLNVLMGEIDPMNGLVVRNGKARIARFSQHHVDGLNLQQTPLEYMQSKFPGADPQAIRSHLGGFGLSGELALQQIYTLSGGQKSRVAFSVLTWNKPHVLLLDEPTNHLDIDTVDVLIQAINEYQGGILLVSHDQYFISSVCDEIWECSEGRIYKFPGDFEEYKRSLKVK